MGKDGRTGAEQLAGGAHPRSLPFDYNSSSSPSGKRRKGNKANLATRVARRRPPPGVERARVARYALEARSRGDRERQLYVASRAKEICK